MTLLTNSWIGGIAGFLAGLIPLIVIHEFGHLIVAKVLGVWAREFGIGFPPRIAKLFKWGETQFTLNWIPLGGFVRLEGEHTFEEPAEETSLAEQDATPEDEEAAKHSLYAQSPGSRSLIFLGGPVMNLIAAWALAVLLFITGIPGPPVYIQDVLPGSPADTAGIQTGDIIRHIGGQAVETLEEVQAETRNNLGTLTEVQIERDAAIQTVTLTPRADPPPGEGSMGILIGYNRLQHYPVFQALVYGTEHIVMMAAMLIAALFILPIDIIRGLVPLSQARPVGVIGISQIAHHSIEASVTAGALYPFFNIVIMIGVSLAIFNLLPIPALDGGRILFALIEKIRDKPLTPEIEERIHIVALAILMTLFIFVTVLDIVSPISLP